MTKKSPLLKLLEDRPVAYHPDLARAFGGVKVAVLLSQFLYWTGRGRLADGWFWKSQEEITEETGLTRTETETARKALVAQGILEERRGRPAMHYRVIAETLQSQLEAYYGRDCGEPTIESAGNQHSRMQEPCNTLPETTPETTPEKKENSSAEAAGENSPPDDFACPLCGCEMQRFDGDLICLPCAYSASGDTTGAALKKAAGAVEFRADCECGGMDNEPGRVQLSRKKGYRMPPNTKKVDRATRWGNHVKGAAEMNKQKAADLFRVGLEKMRRDDPEYFETLVAPLRGQNLACWCALDEPCHADAWLELAAADPPCPECGRPLATTADTPRTQNCCTCVQEATLEAALGPCQAREADGVAVSDAPGWREHFGSGHEFHDEIDPDWGEYGAAVHPCQRVEHVELCVLGWLLQRITGLAPVPGSKLTGWCIGLAAIFLEARGNWAIIERAIRDCWAREEQYRPQNVAQRVNAAKNNGFAVRAGKLWADRVTEKRQPRMVEALGLGEKRE